MSGTDFVRSMDRWGYESSEHRSSWGFPDDVFGIAAQILWGHRRDIAEIRHAGSSLSTIFHRIHRGVIITRGHFYAGSPPTMLPLSLQT